MVVHIFIWIDFANKVIFINLRPENVRLGREKQPNAPDFSK